MWSPCTQSHGQGGNGGVDGSGGCGLQQPAGGPATSESHNGFPFFLHAAPWNSRNWGLPDLDARVLMLPCQYTIITIFPTGAWHSRFLLLSLSLLFSSRETCNLQGCLPFPASPVRGTISPKHPIHSPCRRILSPFHVIHLIRSSPCPHTRT